MTQIGERTSYELLPSLSSSCLRRAGARSRAREARSNQMYLAVRTNDLYFVMMFPTHGHGPPHLLETASWEEEDKRRGTACPRQHAYRGSSSTKCVLDNVGGNSSHLASLCFERSPPGDTLRGEEDEGRQSRERCRPSWVLPPLSRWGPKLMMPIPGCCVATRVKSQKGPIRIGESGCAMGN